MAQLAAGQTISTGSPFKVGGNSAAVTVQLFDRSLADGTRTAIGGFQLDAGEEVDVRFVSGATPQQDKVSLTVNAGTVTITVQGVTATLNEHEQRMEWPIFLSLARHDATAFSLGTCGLMAKERNQNSSGFHDAPEAGTGIVDKGKGVPASIAGRSFEA